MKSSSVRVLLTDSLSMIAVDVLNAIYTCLPLPLVNAISNNLVLGVWYLSYLLTKN